MALQKQCLNGFWDYRIGKGRFGKRQVPFSALPVGKSTVRREFDREGDFPRAFLVLEGITYHARVECNGEFLGEMLPYCRYTFEISHLIREKKNEVSMEIEDMDVVFGPSEGWENYGGIIRDVYVEYCGEGKIADSFFRASYSEDYAQAHCAISLEVDGTGREFRIETVLKNRENAVIHAEERGIAEKAELAFSVAAPILWSPDMPYLYTLESRLYDGQKLLDIRQEKVGFRDFAIQGQRFCLNGKPLFLTGVCRHDLYGDQGHTASREEMRRDMEMIKAAGVNYVRLVHYPHDPYILELADELGMLTSEEPGLWWSDMKNSIICRDSLEVLRRTVLRDRNHVSIAFWLSFNECIFTPEFLMDSARVCRENDDTRLVSGANCMSLEMTKDMFPRCGFDFYTMHPYAAYTDRMKQAAEELDDMPLLLTEWGGHYLYQNPELMKRFISVIREYWQHPDGGKVIAGAAFWCWADMYEFSRAEPACKDGLLKEGLVDKERNPTSILEVFSREFAQINEKPPVEYRANTTAFSQPQKECTALDLSPFSGMTKQDENWEKALNLLRAPIERFYYQFKRERKAVYGPQLHEDVYALGQLPVKLERRPLVILAGDCLEIPAGKKAALVHFIGNVSLPKGYPAGGAYGEEIGSYTLSYQDGTDVCFPLRNGVEITTAAVCYGPSRLNPVAEMAPRALEFSYDFDREQYIANLLSLPIDPEKSLEKIKVQVNGEGYALLVYGITLE